MGGWIRCGPELCEPRGVSLRARRRAADILPDHDNPSHPRVAMRRPENSSFAAAAIAALALASALLAASGTVSYTGSDPRGTLLTAQAILEHGTFALDAYPGVPLDYKIVHRAGRTFYAYPPGTPLLGVPAVAIARIAGLDMAHPEDDDSVQRVLAAISVGLTAVLASLLALRWVPWPLAVLLGGIFVFGTPVISTMGTAFWSINATVVATLFALLLLSGFDESRGGPARAAVIGTLLGGALWCRPTALPIAGLVILWMFACALKMPATTRRSAIVSACALTAAVAVAAALLLLMSALTFGTWLPDYYTGARVAASDRFWTALVAHLVSPSRGALIFAPAAALALGAVLLWPRRVLRVPLAALALAWVCLHLLIVARFPYWWGGFSFGSRLMVDVFPGVFLLLCAAAVVVRDRSRRWRVAGLIALLAAGAAGIWINSVQGLFNPVTASWNVSPEIDKYPGYAFDWRLPQFLSTRPRLEARQERHDRWLLPPLQPTIDYSAASARLELQGWSALEAVDRAEVRRPGGGTPSLRFLVSEETVRDVELLMLTLALGAGRALTGEVWFNGRPVAHVALQEPGPNYYVVAIPRRYVRTLEYDVLKSNVVEWRARGEGQDTPIALWGLRVHAARRRTS